MKKDVKISNNYISVMYNGIPSYGGSQLWFDGDMHKYGCGVIAAADVLMYLKQRIHKAAAKYNAPAKCMLSDNYIKYVEKISPAFPLIPRRGMPCFMLALYLKIYMWVTRMPYRVGFGVGPAAPSSYPSSDLTTAEDAVPKPAASDNNIYNKKITCAAFSPVRLVRSLFKHAAARKHIRTATARESRLRSRIADMLAHDIPVILCIGPGVHQFMKPKAERGIMLYSRSETVRCRSDKNSYFTYTPVRRVRSHFVVITELSGDYARVSSWGKPYYISVAELAHYMKCDMFGLFTNVVRIRERP